MHVSTPLLGLYLLALSSASAKLLFSTVSKGETALERAVETLVEEEQRLKEQAAANTESTSVNDALEVNLLTGETSSLPAGMTWQSPLTSGSGQCECDRQGVLKLTIETGMMAEINMTFSHSTGWTFNVGDSSTNNGYGGDAQTQQNDAEVYSINNNIYFYGRDNVGAGASYGLLHSQAGFVAVNPYSSLTLNVADELATAHNGQSFLYINSYKLFQLNGQSDAGGANHDVYLGMNRVVGNPRVGNDNRVGTGLCRVTVRFFMP